MKIAAFAFLIELLLLFTPSAWAVPSYSRRYGMECSGCHTMWGALNGSGVQFRLSGYRAIGGKDLTPISDDVEITKGVSIPTTLPLSFVTGVGVDARKEKREASDGTSLTSKGSSLALEDASIFMTSPMVVVEAGTRANSRVPACAHCQPQWGSRGPLNRADGDSPLSDLTCIKPRRARPGNVSPMRQQVICVDGYRHGWLAASP